MGDIGRFKTYWQDSSNPAANHGVYSPESVSALLRNARLVQGYDLAEVARSLNIREGHLEALEEGRFRDLPPLVYAKGFVAAYAGFLQLDRGELVSRFISEATNDNSRIAMAPVPQFTFKPEVDVETRRRPPIAIVIGGLLLAAFAYSFWHSAAPSSREVALAVPPLPSRFEEPAQPIALDNIVTAAPAAPAAAVTAQEVYAQPVEAAYSGAGVIVLRAYADGWVQLRTPQGVRVASLVLKPGQSYTLPKGQHLQMETGSLDNLSVIVDGRVAQLNAPVGKTRIQLDLDPACLLDGTAILN